MSSQRHHMLAGVPYAAPAPAADAPRPAAPLSRKALNRRTPGRPAAHHKAPRGI
ncbi:hypothetical protein [Streptomyces sp. NPDC019937]|uniref:hypothetical protein n=1 Tax=Streptomyces sp. NPDC019937 TaxID=3154787 RepID=UPI0033E68408